MCEVSSRVLQAHGATLTPEAVKAGIGKRPIEAWQAVVDLLQVPPVCCTPLADGLLHLLHTIAGTTFHPLDTCRSLLQYLSFDLGCS